MFEPEACELVAGIAGPGEIESVSITYCRTQTCSHTYTQRG